MNKMGVALIFVSHDNIAKSLTDVATAIIQKPTQNIGIVSVTMNADIDEVIDAIEQQISRLDTTKGILFITDIVGATPNNITQLVAVKYRAKILTGLNLAMALCLFNYRELPLKTLLNKAVEGAKKSIDEID